MKKIALAILLLSISACTSIKESVGLVKNQPDEYQVITNPSLEVPPDFNIYTPEEIEARRSKATNINQSGFTKSEKFILENMNK